MSPDNANGPDEVAASRGLAQREGALWTPQSLAQPTRIHPEDQDHRDPDPHADDDHRDPDTQDRDQRPHACCQGVVFLGHLVDDDDGNEVEVVDAVPCR